jgi:hypothetical protein
MPQDGPLAANGPPARTNHDELRSLLARIRRRWFGLTALTTIGRATAVAAIPFVAAAAIVRLAAPAGWTLVAILAISCAAAAGAVVRVILRMQRRPDDCRVARFVEESAAAADLTPVACDTLVTAVEVVAAPDRHSGVFSSLLVRQAVVLLRGIDPRDLIPPAAVRKAAGQAAGGAALLALTLAAVGPGWAHAGATIWVSAFPRSIGIQVLSGNVRVPSGQPLRLSAAVTGRSARLLSVVPSLVVSANGEQRTVPMTASGGAFSYSFESVDRSFQYRVVAGGAASDAFTVTALSPPKVQSIDVSYIYPSFTGFAPREDKDGGDVYAPAGTRVRLQIHADKPLAGGQLRLAGGQPVRLATDNDSASAEMVLAKDDAYRVQLSDRDGLASTGDVEYFIRVMDDRPPAVHIVRPNGDQGITPLEEVTIEARADDDYGIAELDLVYAVAGRPAKTVPFMRLSGSAVARVGAHLLAAEDLKVQPGDVITYYARARDVARAKPSSEAKSDMFFLEVKPFTEEFVQAQSQAMGGGAQSAQLDALIAAQKEIINATWNLERRSAAGRSSEDIKAVGDAQAELKTKVERLAGGPRRGGRGFFPQQILPQPPGSTREPGRNPVAEAVAAMGRAVEQLHGTRTADALPHEMAALQGLLQAQAEVRRREVMQQSASAGGGGGTSRTDRDLSALFDRELQRQQRTNYETPRPTAEAPERHDDELLDRISELARRQEELARRQRELAGARLDADEMKRQLERLSREQQELRQQADALQKQTQGGAAGRGSPSGTPDASMQRAAEQMRNAANEMQRQNAGGAAASAEQAAQGLRQLEEQMRGSSASARQRTAGEMQLEAQQLADAQRRIASEMSRLEKDRSGSGAAAGDAARRLAGDKDKLADRVDALERAARAAQRSSPGQEGAKFADAARQLQEQQIGSRMRQSAEQLRGQPSSASGRAGQEKTGQERTGRGKTGQETHAGGAASNGAAEQQLARALDAVATTLRGGSADGERRLAEELDRTRDIRERLNGLERQVRDAEAKQAKQGGGNGAGGEAERLREQYTRELQRSRESLGRMQAEQRDGGGATPEQHEWSRSAPGNEAFKQDFKSWESLRKDVDLALERYEAGLSARLGRKAADDRLSGGGSERVPDAYRPLVSKYFESLARDRK